MTSGAIRSQFKVFTGNEGSCQVSWKRQKRNFLWLCIARSCFGYALTTIKSQIFQNFVKWSQRVKVLQHLTIYLLIFAVTRTTRGFCHFMFLLVSVVTFISYLQTRFIFRHPAYRYVKCFHRRERVDCLHIYRHLSVFGDELGRSCK